MIADENKDRRRSMQDLNIGFPEGENENLPQVFRPWRRFFARMLDLGIYSIPWTAFIAFVLNVNISNRSIWGNMLDAYAAMILMLFIEPLLLKLFGTTPGKAVFGLRVISDRGEYFSYFEGFERTWRVLGRGYGFNIPIYGLVRLWKSYKTCANNEVQPWDENTVYTIKDTKWLRPVACIAVYALSFAVIVTITLAQSLPPNRGDITVAQFVANHNYYAKYFGVSFGNWELDRNGEWFETVEHGIVWIDLFGSVEKPEYQFVLRDGFVHGIFFQFELSNAEMILLNSYEAHMFVASLALAGAQKEMRMFSGIPSRIANHIALNLARSYQFSEAGVTIAWEIEKSGFVDIPGALFLLADNNSAETHFSLRFSSTKLGG